jgi:hypothetical protein
MRRLLTLLIIGAVLAPLAACGSEPDRESSAAGTPTPSAAASSAPGGPAATGSPSPPATGASSEPATTKPSRTTTAPPDAGELPGGLPFGERKLTGVIELSGNCAMLRVGNRLWGLTGKPLGALAAGDRVTVEGQVTTPDPACGVPDVSRALVVRRVTPA